MNSGEKTSPYKHRVRSDKRAKTVLDWASPLFDRDFTAREAGEVSGHYGPDAITRLRESSQVTLEVVGERESGDGAFRPKRKVKVYRLRRGKQGRGQK